VAKHNVDLIVDSFVRELNAKEPGGEGSEMDGGRQGNDKDIV
jgi:hypothetical protein